MSKFHTLAGARKSCECGHSLEVRDAHPTSSSFRLFSHCRRCATVASHRISIKSPGVTSRSECFYPNGGETCYMCRLGKLVQVDKTTACCDNCALPYKLETKMENELENNYKAQLEETTGLDLVAALQAQQGMRTVSVKVAGLVASRTYKKPVDMELSAGDYVLVPHARPLVVTEWLVGKVTEVHDYARLEEGVRYRWCGPKVELPDIAEIEGKEDAMREALRAAEQRKRAESAYQAALEAAGLTPDQITAQLPLLR